jgi:hypothetical protein
MRRHIPVALVSLSLLGTVACNDFLTGNKLSSNPNQPSQASISQLFVAVQAGQFAMQEGTVPMMICMWAQQCGGTNGRFVEQAGRYVFGESSNIGANGGDWALVYDAGGLVDIRQVKADATAAGDSTWLGIAKVWEALAIGTASDMWGAIPYSEVTTNATPALDPRFAVLDSAQSLLSQAIAELTNAAGAGPGSVDLVFGGDRAKWIKAAWTLKARYYMHTAESLGAPAYTNAITAALQGISDATGGSDLAGFHSGSGAGERNMWAAFQASSSFGQDIVAGKPLVDIMNARSDPRLPAYFCLNTAGAYVGQDFNVPVADVSAFGCNPSPLRFEDTYSMPYVSYAENELILAEAYNQTGDDVNGILHLNNARAYANATYPPTAGPPATAALPVLAGIVGAALLDSIMIEKYVAMFQNIESINDYRRTCIPALTVVTNNQGFANVPGRLFYPLIERNVNPNIPDPSAQLAPPSYFRNQGDVHACTLDTSP